MRISRELFVAAPVSTTHAFSVLQDDTYTHGHYLMATNSNRASACLRYIWRGQFQSHMNCECVHTHEALDTVSATIPREPGAKRSPTDQMGICGTKNDINIHTCAISNKRLKLLAFTVAD